MADIYQWPFDRLLDFWFRMARADKARRMSEAETKQQTLHVVTDEREDRDR